MNKTKPKSISALVVFMLAVAACMAVVTAQVAYGHEFRPGVEVGDVHPMSAVCDAEGANKASAISVKH